MSKQVSNSSVALLSFCLVLMLFMSVGCKGEGYSLAPATGVVTLDDKPVVGVEIIFSPTPTKENPAPGPFSIGKTDSQGKFEMVARGGKPGVVVWPQEVMLSIPDDSNEEALGEAQEALRELISEGDADPADIKEAKDKIANIKEKLSRYAFIPRHLLKGPIANIDVQAEGLVDHAFALTSSK